MKLVLATILIMVLAVMVAGTPTNHCVGMCKHQVTSK